MIEKFNKNRKEHKSSTGKVAGVMLGASATMFALGLAAQGEAKSAEHIGRQDDALVAEQAAHKAFRDGAGAAIPGVVAGLITANNVRKRREQLNNILDEPNTVNTAFGETPTQPVQQPELPEQPPANEGEQE